jgi:hypothetical protein
MAPTTRSPRYEICSIRMIVLTSTKILQAKTEEGTRGGIEERIKGSIEGEGEKELVDKREDARREACASVSLLTRSLQTKVRTSSPFDTTPCSSDSLLPLPESAVSCGLVAFSPPAWSCSTVRTPTARTRAGDAANMLYPRPPIESILVGSPIRPPNSTLGSPLMHSGSKVSF